MALMAAEPQPLIAPKEIGIPSLPKRDEKQLVADIMERFREALEAKRSVETWWYKCISFLMGNQWVDWQDGSGLLPRATGNYERYQLVMNLTEPALRTAVARLIAKKPWFGAMPMSPDEDDQNAARIAGKLLKYWRLRTFNQNRMTMAANWMVCCGTCFFRVGWDRYAGQMVNARTRAPSGSLLTAATEARPDESEEAVPSEFERFLGAITGEATTQPGQRDDRETEAATPAIGDVLLEVVNPFEVYPQPHIDDWDALSWCIQAKRISLAEVRELFGDDIADTCKPATAESEGGFDDKQVIDDWRSYNFGSILGQSDLPDKRKVMVLEYWERPSRRFRSGRQVLIVGERVVQDRPNPYPFKDIPLVPAHYQRIPGFFWGRGLVDSMMPAQEQFNIANSQLAEAMSYVSHPKALVPRSANISKSKMRNVPFEILEYSGGMKPDWLEPPGMPAWMGTIMQTQYQFMQEITHQHDVSKGSTPPNVEAGIAIQQLQEADIAPLRAMYDSFDEALLRCARYMLLMAQRYYTDYRIISIIGDTHAPEVVEFTGADLYGVADVYVDPRSALPDSLVARREFILGLYDRMLLGAQGDPAVSKRVLRSLEMGQYEALFDDQPTFDELFMMELAKMVQQLGLDGTIQWLRQIAGPQMQQAPQAAAPGG